MHARRAHMMRTMYDAFPCKDVNEWAAIIKDRSMLSPETWTLPPSHATRRAMEECTLTALYADNALSDGGARHETDHCGRCFGWLVSESGCGCPGLVGQRGHQRRTTAFKGSADCSSSQGTGQWVAQDDSASQATGKWVAQDRSAPQAHPEPFRPSTRRVSGPTRDDSKLGLPSRLT